MGFIHRRILKLVLAVVHRPKLTLFIAALLLLGSIVVAMTSLKISSDQNKLFSSNIGFFHDYLDFIQKFPENEAVYVIIEATDAHNPPPLEQWTNIADRLSERLAQLHKYVQGVDAKVPLEKLGVQGLLFENPALLHQDFAQIQQFGQLAKLWGQNGLLQRLLGRTRIGRFLSGMAMVNSNQQQVSFLEPLARSWVTTLQTDDQPLEIGKQIPDLSALGANDPSRLGYYYVPDESDPSRHLMLVRVYVKTSYNSLTAITNTVGAVRSAVQNVAKQYPQFTVGITGRPALDADEMRTTDHDTHNAEIVALAVVFAAMTLMLRSIWLALVAEISLAVGIGWTFGWATISVGELNLLSIVFVIALIGIGMDYLVQILTRYRREARRYVRPAAVWARVFRYVSPPIFTACLGAAGAFFASILTNFRGAAELGIIAGGGLLLCLLSGYTVLPAILVLRPARIKPLHTSLRYRPPPPRRIHPAWRLLLPVIWIAALIACIPFARRAQFNPNLLELQAPNLRSVQLIRKVKTWSGVVLSKDLDMLAKVRNAVKMLPTVTGTESILDARDNYHWLMEHQSELPKIDWIGPAPLEPRDVTTLAEKSAMLASHIDRTFKPQNASEQQLKAQTISALQQFTTLLRAVPEAQRASVAQRLSQWQRLFVDELHEMFKQFSPPPLNIQAVPKELRGHFISADGTYALYIYPKKDLWNRGALAQFVTSVESRVAQVPGAPAVTGIAPNIYHSTASIERAFYKATFYALALILILVFLDLKRIVPTLLAVSVLALGLPMLVAIMGAFGIDWNFANFFGLPILIGAGHEYGVFMIHRYREVQHNPRRVWGRWDVSDRALLLCAFITSSSFGFFYALGHHRGLMSLGMVMALGIACIYLATIMVLRPILRWRIDRKKFYHQVFQIESSSEEDE